MSSSDTRGLKAQEELILGETIPEKLYYDDKGQIVADPSKWGSYLKGWGIKGGAMRKSGYRDLCLSVIMDVLGGALSGMSCAKDLDTPEPAVDGLRTPRGQFCMAIDIDQFTPIEEFKRKIDRMIDQAKSSRLAEGFTEILMPGEKEFKEVEKRRKDGVPVYEKVWEKVKQSVKGLGREVEKVIQAQ